MLKTIGRVSGPNVYFLHFPSCQQDQSIAVHCRIASNNCNFRISSTSSPELIVTESDFPVVAERTQRALDRHIFRKWSGISPFHGLPRSRSIPSVWSPVGNSRSPSVVLDSEI